MSTNPYSAPRSADNSPATPRLYSPMQIAMGAFLGSFAAGGILLAENFYLLGKQTAATVSVVAGIIGSLLMIGVAMQLPDSAPGTLLGIVQTVAMLAVAKSLQGKAFKEHIASGGEAAKGWRPVLISLGTAAVLFGLILVVSLV